MIDELVSISILSKSRSSLSPATQRNQRVAQRSDSISLPTDPEPREFEVYRLRRLFFLSL